MKFRWTVILLLVVLFVVLIAQNTGDTSITFLFWTMSTSKPIMLGITFLVGLVVGFLSGRPWRRKKKEYAKVKKVAGKADK